MRLYLAAAGVNGAMGVAMGAWAAHGLPAEASSAAVEWVRTGASYQLWHAAALLGLGAAATSCRHRLFALAGWALGLGAMMFATALYLRALAGPELAGPLAPVGGVMMIGGWLALIAAAVIYRIK